MSEFSDLTKAIEKVKVAYTSDHHDLKAKETAELESLKNMGSCMMAPGVTSELMKAKNTAMSARAVEVSEIAVMFTMNEKRTKGQDGWMFEGNKEKFTEKYGHLSFEETKTVLIARMHAA